MRRRHAGQALLSTLLLPMAPLVRAQEAVKPRIVSLGGSMTELLWRLGAQDLVVGTDTTSTHPEAALRTTKVGYMRQLSAEGLLALRPTVVLGTDEAGPPAVLQQLTQAGVPLLLAKADHSVAELMNKLSLAGQASGRQPQALALKAELTERLGQVAQAVAAQAADRKARGARAPRVLFVMCHGGRPQSAGSGTAAHAMLLLAGAHNAMATGAGYKALSAESVVQAQPDIIVTTHDSIVVSGGEDGFWRHPGLALTPAARQRRLVTMDAMALLGFGPRLPEVLMALHRAVS